MPSLDETSLNGSMTSKRHLGHQKCARLWRYRAFCMSNSPTHRLHRKRLKSPTGGCPEGVGSAKLAGRLAKTSTAGGDTWDVQHRLRFAAAANSSASSKPASLPPPPSVPAPSCPPHSLSSRPPRPGPPLSVSPHGLPSSYRPLLRCWRVANRSTNSSLLPFDGQPWALQRPRNNETDNAVNRLRSIAAPEWRPGWPKPRHHPFT
mmetsp:Transcript_57982/g.161807  ORF Transcript_57982/g.161807 Transcript_57982/m.161807 type:complete len:205 (-) Transcript_57982:25-639(-)